MVDVLGNILDWSADRPAWQRDALRRLVLADELNYNDFTELTELCKTPHGLSEGRIAEPLNKTHLPTNPTELGIVDLLSITHHRGVNALAEDQTITFGPGLTVVYGDNASGKSGYTRILKSACQARGAEIILGNVLSGTAPPALSVSIRFKAGNDGIEHEWPDKPESDGFLGRVSVFDSHSSAVYLNEKTDVAFRPFGLDLFDKLSKCCEEVNRRLDQECRSLTSTGAALPELPEGTSAHKLVSNLSSLTKRESLIALCTLTSEEKETLILLEKRLDDIGSDDPQKTADILKLRAHRLEAFLPHLDEIDLSLHADTLKLVFAAQKAAQLKQTEATKLRDATFLPDLLILPDLLNGTGSGLWAELWDAARRFSMEEAYVNQPFPVTKNDARCVLCQQPFDEHAVARLTQFQTFIASQAEREFNQAKEHFDQLFTNLASLKVFNEAAENAVKELRIETDTLATALEEALELAVNRHSEALKALSENTDLPSNLSEYSSQKTAIQILTKELDQRIKGLSAKADPQVTEQLTKELQELKSREALAKYEQVILNEIDRKARLAAYELCLRDTRTRAITIKSTEVTKEVVTNQLKTSFSCELGKFNFTHVEVELQEAGGELGTLYHKLILRRAPGVELPKVVSEGEACCLSIAAFFAELSTADDPSAILFDDPVSSLDHKWRTSVAHRLVQEAKTRQVIVFTHDIVFLLALHRYADEQDIKLHDQQLRSDKLGAGVCEEELPWLAMKVRTRIGVLKNSWQEADKLHRAGDRRAYEREAILIYGFLREAWERGLEEVLLAGMVERYRENIETRQIRKLSDITEEDCEQLEAGMTKCSKWLPGHDQAPAANEDVPGPDQLGSDIDDLEQWVRKINARRN